MSNVAEATIADTGEKDRRSDTLCQVPSRVLHVAEADFAELEHQAKSMGSQRLTNTCLRRYWTCVLATMQTESMGTIHRQRTSRRLVGKTMSTTTKKGFFAWQ